MLEKVKASFNFMIETLGQDLTFESAVDTYDHPKVTKKIRAGFSGGSGDDDDSVNVYGTDSKTITVTAQSGIVPVKNDRFKNGKETFVAAAVKPLHLGAEIIGYKVHTKGK